MSILNSVERNAVSQQANRRFAIHAKLVTVLCLGQKVVL